MQGDSATLAERHSLGTNLNFLFLFRNPTADRRGAWRLATPDISQSILIYRCFKYRFLVFTILVQSIPNTSIPSFTKMTEIKIWFNSKKHLGLLIVDLFHVQNIACSILRAQNDSFFWSMHNILITRFVTNLTLRSVRLKGIHYWTIFTQHYFYTFCRSYIIAFSLNIIHTYLKEFVKSLCFVFLFHISRTSSAVVDFVLLCELKGAVTWRRGEV